MVYGSSDKTSIQTLSSSDMHGSGQYFTDEPEFEEKHEGKTGVARTSFNVLCLVVGAGILNLPAALELSGWFGVIPLFMFAFFAAYTAILISKCMRPPDGPGLRTYAEIGHKAFGKWGQVLSDIMVHSNLVGAGISYLILCGQNLSFLLQNFPLTSGNYSLWDLSAAGGMSITAILLWFHVFFETMHEISIVSFFNLMVAVILTVVVIAEIFANPITGTVETKFFTNFLNVGGAMSSMAYAYGAHAALPTVHDAMKDKNKFPLMIIISYCIIIVFYVPLSIIGYNAYGCDTMSPIYDNLCSSIEANCNWIEAFGKYASIFLVTVHVFLAYMLNINPTEIAIEKLLKVETRKEPFIWRVINRSIIVIFTLILAEVIPSFQDFIGLVGSISTTFTIFVMPPLFYMKIYHGRIGIPTYIIAGLTILIGIYVGLFGTYHAVQSIICLFGDYSFCEPAGCS